jgi:membrane protein CcdC involved in cytochrome C biogenesis
MMHRSAAFFVVVVVLALVRFLARGYIDRFITLEQTAGLFFVLAFGMILRWRMSMYFEYRRITGTLSPS